MAAGRGAAAGVDSEEAQKQIEAQRAAFFRKLQVERENYRRTAYECMRHGDYENAKNCFKHFVLDPGQVTGELRERELEYRRDLIMCRMNCANTFENLREGLEDIKTVLHFEGGDVQLLLVKAEFHCRLLEFETASGCIHNAMLSDMSRIETKAHVGLEIQARRKAALQTDVDETTATEATMAGNEEELPKGEELINKYIELMEKRIPSELREGIPPREIAFDVTRGERHEVLKTNQQMSHVLEGLYGRLTQIGKQNVFSLDWAEIHESVNSPLCDDLLATFGLDTNIKPFLHQILDWNIERAECASPFDGEKEAQSRRESCSNPDSEPNTVALLFLKLELVTLFAHQLWGGFADEFIDEETRRRLDVERREASGAESSPPSLSAPHGVHVDEEMDAHIKAIDTLLVKASVTPIDMPDEAAVATQTGEDCDVAAEDGKEKDVTSCAEETKVSETTAIGSSSAFSTYMVDTGLYGCRDGVDFMSAVVWTSFEPSSSLSCLFEVTNPCGLTRNPVTGWKEGSKLLLNEKWLTSVAFRIVQFLANREPPNVRLLTQVSTPPEVVGMDAASWERFMRVRVRAHLGVDPDLSENHVLSRDAQEESKIFERKMVALLGCETAKDLMQRELDMSIPLLHRYAILMSKISGIDEDVLIYELTLPDEEVEESETGATATLSRERLLDNGIDLTGKLLGYKPIGLPSLIQASTFNIFPSSADDSTYEKTQILEELRVLEKSVVQFHIDYKRVVYEEAGSAKARELEKVMNNLQLRGLELTKWLRNFVKFMIIRRDIEQDILDVSGRNEHSEGMKWFDVCTARVSAATSLLVTLISRRFMTNLLDSFHKIAHIEPVLANDLVTHVTTPAIAPAQELRAADVEPKTESKAETSMEESKHSTEAVVMMSWEEESSAEESIEAIPVEHENGTVEESMSMGLSSTRAENDMLYETVPSRLRKLKQMVGCYQRILRVMNKKFVAKDGDAFQAELLHRISHAKLRDMLRVRAPTDGTAHEQERELSDVEKAELQRRYNTTDIEFNDVTFELEECKKALGVSSLVVPIICTEMSSSVVEKSLEACRQHESTSAALGAALASAEHTELYKKEVRDSDGVAVLVNENASDDAPEEHESEEFLLPRSRPSSKRPVAPKADKRIIYQYLREQGLRYRVCMDRSLFVYNHLFVVIYCVHEGIALTVHTFPTNANKFQNCAFCRKVLSTKRCDGCGIVHYCSKECQIVHWKDHSQECRLFQTTGQPTCYMTL